MINLDKLVSSENKITVTASDNLFEELGRNTYDYKDLLSELIDNSIAARHHDSILNVTIDIFVAPNYKPIEFVIRDDAKGINETKMGQAISPASIQSRDSLNEHGMGMKQAVAALGKLNYLASKVIGEEKARVIREFKFGELDTYETDFDGKCGTEISIKNLNSVVTTKSAIYTRSIVSYLGARYRRFLKPDDKKLNLIINLRKDDEREHLLNSWMIEETKPIYFHPSTRTNSPVILAHTIQGDGWMASLTFGYAPTKKEEYEELGLEEPNKYQPYKVGLNTQGLDIIFHDRIILFHQLSEIGIVPAKHNDYNMIRGEIDLKYGFSTAITKNSIIKDQNFEECVEKIRNILIGKDEGPNKRTKDYITQKTYPDQIPEKLLRNRLMKWLKTNPLNKKNNVKSEYVVEGIEGYIDILADGEAWELKIEQASALDVYQLFMYMDVGKISKGFLVAKSFTTGAQVAAEHIKENHEKEIVLTTRDQFPINHPPTDEERGVYY